MILSFLAIIMIFIIMIISGVVYLINTEKTIHTIVSEKFELDKEIRRAELIIANIHSNIWDTVLFNIDNKEEAIEVLHDEARDFYSVVDNLEEIGDRARFQQVRETFRSYYQFGSTFLRMESLEEFVQRKQSIDKFQSNKKRLNELLTDTVESTKKEFEESLYKLDKDFTNARYLLIVSIIICSLIAFILVTILTGILIKPILSLTKTAEKITDGDLNAITEVKGSDEVGILADTFNKMILSIKHYQSNLEDIVKKRTLQLSEAMDDLKVANKELIETRDALWGEMELAKKIQTVLLPEKISHAELEIAAEMVTADEVGGDYYDFIYDNNDSLWISIGDVSGHGVTPGLIMMMAQTAHLNSVQEQLNPSPRTVISSVNKLLSYNITGRLKETNFMTMTSMKYLGKGDFIYSGAHLDILVYRDNSQEVELFETSGTFLNLIPDISEIVTEDRLHLNSGDIMVLYTDGVIEAIDKSDKLLDISGLIHIVEKNSQLSTEKLKDCIISNVMDWCNGNYKDDITVLVVKKR